MEKLNSTFETKEELFVYYRCFAEKVSGIQFLQKFNVNWVFYIA